MTIEILCSVTALFKMTFWLFVSLINNPGQSHNSRVPGSTCTGNTLPILSPESSHTIRSCVNWHHRSFTAISYDIPVSGNLSTRQHWRRQSQCTGSRRTARPPARGSWRSDLSDHSVDGNAQAILCAPFEKGIALFEATHPVKHSERYNFV